MIYQEKFDLNKDSAEYFSKEFDIIITGFREPSDVRHSRVLDDLSFFNGIIYSFDICDNADKFHYKKEDSDRNELSSAYNRNLIPDLEKLLRSENFDGTKICLDITSIKQGLLFLLVKILMRDVKPECLFAAYTEPLEYKKRNKIEVGENEEYDLYNRIVGSSKGVPGFFKSQTQKNVMLIASMGFDSQRLQTIYESLKPVELIPIVGFPSFVPGWNLTAIKMNNRVLKESNCFDSIVSCEAASPFEIYKFLKETYNRKNNDFALYLCPLGSRPHVLGMALFATAYFPNVFLIYDFPVEKKYRSENVLKSSIYHLSSFIGASI